MPNLNPPFLDTDPPEADSLNAAAMNRKFPYKFLMFSYKRICTVTFRIFDALCVDLAVLVS